MLTALPPNIQPRTKRTLPPGSSFAKPVRTKRVLPSAAAVLPPDGCSCAAAPNDGGVAAAELQKKLEKKVVERPATPVAPVRAAAASRSVRRTANLAYLGQLTIHCSDDTATMMGDWCRRCRLHPADADPSSLSSGNDVLCPKFSLVPGYEVQLSRGLGEGAAKAASTARDKAWFERTNRIPAHSNDLLRQKRRRREAPTERTTVQPQQPRQSTHFTAGDKVEYNSSRWSAWIKACVESPAYNEDGTINLDVREEADPSRVRFPSTPADEEGGDKDHAVHTEAEDEEAADDEKFAVRLASGHEGIRPGDKVQYLSTKHRAWIDAVVEGCPEAAPDADDESGEAVFLVDLDVREDADCRRIRNPWEDPELTSRQRQRLCASHTSRRAPPEPHNDTRHRSSAVTPLAEIAESSSSSSSGSSDAEDYSDDSDDWTQATVPLSRPARRTQLKFNGDQQGRAETTLQKLNLRPNRKPVRYYEENSDSEHDGSESGYTRSIAGDSNARAVDEQQSSSLPKAGAEISHTCARSSSWQRTASQPALVAVPKSTTVPVASTYAASVQAALVPAVGTEASTIVLEGPSQAAQEQQQHQQQEQQQQQQSTASKLRWPGRCDPSEQQLASYREQYHTLKMSTSQRRPALLKLGRSRVSGRGIFLNSDVDAGTVLCEYTCVRVSSVCESVTVRC